MTKAGSIPIALMEPAAGPDRQGVSATATDNELRPERLIPLLLSAGVLTASDALRRGIDLQQIGRSHSVWRLSLGGQPWAAVKLFGASRGQTDGSAACEHGVAALAREVPALAALVAERVEHDGPPWLTVNRWVDGQPGWVQNDPVAGSGAPAGSISALAPRVAPALAAMHRATARRRSVGALGAMFDGAVPWVLTLFDADAPPELWSHALLAPVLAEAGMRPRLVAGLRRARGAWRAVALVHGDLKHDNLVLRADGGVALVDWELARVGDPAWDLAGLMFRPLLDPDPQMQGWTEANCTAASALLAAYVGDSGLKQQPLAQRLLLFCGAWVLMSVVQYRSTATQPDIEETRRLLDLAEASLTASDELVQKLAGACA